MTSSPSPEDFPGRILHQTCIYNNSEFLGDLLKGPECSNVNALDAAGRSVIYSAVSNRSKNCLELLLQAGGNPDVPCERFNGQTPLHQAALDGREDLVKLLLEYRADFSKKDNTDKLPLDLAREMSHSGCVNLLKDAQDTRDGALSQDVPRRVVAGRPLNRSGAVFASSLYTHKLELQLSNLAECDIQKCNEYVTILDRKKVKDIVTKLTDRLSLLYRACVVKRADLVLWLIEQGATCDYDKSSKQTPLYAACRNDSVEAVTTLMQHFPQLFKVVTGSSVGKLHCLHLACQGSLELLKVLMEWPYQEELLEYHYTSDRKYCYRSAFDVNVVNFTLWTALYFATASNKPEIVKYLLQYEVNGYPLSSSFSDLSESDIPQALANIEEYIESEKPTKTIRPVDVCPVAVDSTAPLHHAARHGYLEIAELLIQHGADINQVCDYQDRGVADPQKYTALLFAVREGNKDMISLLLKSGVRDDNSVILTSCFLQSDKEMVTFILKHKAHVDQQYKMSNQMMAASRRPPSMDDLDGDFHSPVAINWHGVALTGHIEDDWLYESSLYINPAAKRSVCLDAITSIDVTATSLISLPGLLFTLKHLISLNASSNSLQALPKAELWQLPNLREVFLDKNNFIDIPEGLFLLPALEKLSMMNNGITSVSYSLWTAPKLVDVNLSFNKINHVASSPPSTDFSMRRRDIQEIEAVDLIDVPDRPSFERNTSQIGRCTVLNKWSDLLEVVDTFEYSSDPDATLTTINLSHNELKQVPKGLACLAPKLHRLNLSYNRIDRMGPASSYPMSLANLNLSYNKIKRISSDVDAMEEVVIGRSAPKHCYCPFRKEPRRSTVANGSDVNLPRARTSTGSLSSLSSLTAGLCRHRSLRFDNLTAFFISHNKLDQINFNIIDQLESDNISEKSNRSGSVADSVLLFPKLTQLDVSHNELRDISPSIAEHTELSQLNLRCNLIRDLPPEMGLLKSLWNMELSGCPLEGPLAEKVERKSKTSDILGFLCSVLKDAKPYASMKLMIVGRANIGKTTLLLGLKKEGRSNNPFRHFNQRVSNAPVAGDSRRGDTVSTVGVDIGDLTFDRKGGKGKVMFKTWDFGGQEEYYATHQYFLSKRSLYLVLYKLTDGEDAVENLKQWLVNIQTRSPGAPVIIVGSHLDVLKKSKDWRQRVQSLRELIRAKFMVREPATVGLPHVKDMIEVGRNMNNTMTELANMIHREAWALKAPGSSSMALLEQRIPAIYISLERVVSQLSQDLLAAKKNPVLNAQQYRSMVSDQIAFRDMDELNQATQFLHDNGVLLHYQDVALCDLYFLDPQWLCDMLAHVITIKQINGFVKSGVMETKHLEQLFGKSAIFQAEDLQTYIISLLSKFELALRWDQDHLLLPSLLPSEHDMDSQEFVQVPMCQTSSIKRKSAINSLRLRQRRAFRAPRADSLVENGKEEGNSTFYVENETSQAATNAEQNSLDVLSLENSYVSTDSPFTDNHQPAVLGQMSSRPHESLRRLYLLSYIPSGFWPRLISRIYSDHTISILTEFLFDVPSAYKDVLQSQTACSWQCWKTGLALKYFTFDLLKVRQVHETSEGALPYFSGKLYIAWEDLFKGMEVANMCVLEVEIPDNMVEISLPDNEEPSIFNTSRDVRAKLLAKLVDHIETLLEDWYPDLGEKFQQNARGEFLVRRLVICPSCIEQWPKQSVKRSEPTDGGEEVTTTHSSTKLSKKKRLVPIITCYSVEELLIRQYDKLSSMKCYNNHSLSMSRYAPDLVFADIYNTMTLDDVSLGAALGKGAYGVVFAGFVKRESLTRPAPGAAKLMPWQNYQKRNAIALKTLQPHDPGEDCSASLRRHYEQAARKWNDQTARNVFGAYCNARQELNILSVIHHPNIVSLVGVLLQPLSLVLERAPRGSLQDTIEDYARAGVKLPFTSIQQIVVQVASALSYLHNESRLIYRDLKAENVLVWQMPAIHGKQAGDTVEVRLADFGVSRAATDKTAKGNWGTPGYMAPEIIEFQGKEAYTEKVDCYSFGSFLYEMVTLKRPFHNGDGNINSYVLAGKRPAISNLELSFPINMLDLMAMCWSADPNNRPAADEIAAIASHPHFPCLQEPVKTDDTIDYVTSTCVTEKSAPFDMTASVHDMSFEMKMGLGYHVYVAGGVRPGSTWQGRVDRLTYSVNGQYVSTDTCQLPLGCPLINTCTSVNEQCWLADSEGDIHVLTPRGDNVKPDIQTFSAASPVECGRVKQMLFAEDANRLFCLLQKGFLLEYDTMTLTKISCRKVSDLTCSAMVQVDECLWIGMRDAYIKVLPIHELLNECESVSDWMSSDQSYAHLLNHYSPVEQLVDTAYLVTDSEKNFVWSNVYPGAHVYRWNAHDHVIEDSCDIAAVVNCMPGQDHISSPSIQLAALSYHCGRVIAASTSSFVVILDASTLTPLSTLQPHHTASYRTFFSIQPLPSSGRFLTLGVGYSNALDLNNNISKPSGNKPSIHTLSWYINPTESL